MYTRNIYFPPASLWGHLPDPPFPSPLPYHAHILTHLVMRVFLVIPFFKGVKRGSRMSISDDDEVFSPDK